MEEECSAFLLICIGIFLGIFLCVMYAIVTDDKLHTDAIDASYQLGVYTGLKVGYDDGYEDGFYDGIHAADVISNSSISSLDKQPANNSIPYVMRGDESIPLKNTVEV